MKSLTLVLCVIAILGAAASTFFYVQIGDTKKQLQSEVAAANTRSTEVQAKLAESTTQGEALQKRLAASDSDLGEAKSKVTAADSRNTQLSRDVAQLRNQVTAKEDAEKSLNGEIGQLKSDLAKAKLSASAATPEEVEQYKQTITTLKTRVTELESSAPAVGAVGGVASSAPGTAHADASKLNGQVVSIGAQNGFVVLNLGSAQGVQVNQHFALTRNGAHVATAVVSSVQDNYSIAQISTETLRGGLSKGDSASAIQ